MEKFGYNPVRFKASLWKHETNDTIFALVVENFCANYISESNEEHFLNALRQKYSTIVDRKAEIFVGISLKWDCIQRTVTISIPEHIKQALHKI